ncbi:MAG: GerMN domain-containing protein [Clostridia bacterium]|nr:GerMN domain-containing protein [Clostridia bacterium]
MRKKIIIGVIILLLIIVGVFVYFNVGIETEYIPESEIDESEYRNTIISLYFQNKESKELQIETRLIDSKELLDNPYNKLINLLLEGTTLETLESAIPKETKLIGTVLENDCLVVNLSKEFIEKQEGDAVAKVNSIYSIVNTVTELKEITSVRILIEGEANKGFESDGIKFDNVFVRIK